MQTTIGEVRKPYDCPSDIICLVLKALKLKKSQFFENKKRGTPPDHVDRCRGKGSCANRLRLVYGLLCKPVRIGVGVLVHGLDNGLGAPMHRYWF